MKLPPYTHFPNIQGDRISLRHIEYADLNELIAISFYDSIQATTLQEAEEMQARINGDYENGNSIHWGIADNQTNKLVGTCGFYRGFDEGAGELGCVLLQAFRGQGYMSAALQLAINFGFNNIGLKRIWAGTSIRNEKAQKLLERLNFTKAGAIVNGEIVYERYIVK